MLAHMIAQGECPSLTRYFLEEGSFCRATSVFPSTTGPAYLPFLTGCFPGTCNLPGIRWFDKARFGGEKFSLKKYRSYVGFESLLMNRDFNPEIKTLFDFFPKSSSIFTAIDRGVPWSGRNTAISRFWYWYYGHLTDRWDWVDRIALEKTLRMIRGDFEFIFAVFPGIDTLSHLSHPFHPAVLDAYRTLDRSVGKIFHELDRQGKGSETAVFLVSDHGLSSTHRHFGVAASLEDLGLKAFYYPRIFKKDFEVASMVSGNAMLHLYFKGERGWPGRMSVEEIQELHPSLVARLLENPAIDHILGKGLDGFVHILSRSGAARVRETKGGVLFENRKGNPLGLDGVSGFIKTGDSLKLTEATLYPDSLVQIAQIFRSPRTGDLILSAASGHDLRQRFEFPEHKSSHGSLHRDHIWTPLLSSVPVPHKTVRSADLFPSILKLAGRPIPAGIDGVPFL